MSNRIRMMLCIMIFVFFFFVSERALYVCSLSCQKIWFPLLVSVMRKKKSSFRSNDQPSFSRTYEHVHIPACQFHGNAARLFYFEEKIRMFGSIAKYCFDRWVWFCSGTNPQKNIQLNQNIKRARKRERNFALCCKCYIITHYSISIQNAHPILFYMKAKDLYDCWEWRLDEWKIGKSVRTRRDIEEYWNAMHTWLCQQMENSCACMKEGQRCGVNLAWMFITFCVASCLNLYCSHMTKNSRRRWRQRQQIVYVSVNKIKARREWREKKRKENNNICTCRYTLFCYSFKMCSIFHYINTYSMFLI